jgi:hypothetical protein
MEGFMPALGKIGFCRVAAPPDKEQVEDGFALLLR